MSGQCPRFVYEESEVQKDEVTCPKSHSQKLAHRIQHQAYLTVKLILLSKIEKPENQSVWPGFATSFLCGPFSSLSFTVLIYKM